MINLVESIGKRIASLRQKYGWTQQSLADRLAMSRVAISHIEMDLSIPSERSITLMAGIFKLSPIELVQGTSYPKAKAERLPDLTNTYTDLELHHALFKNDLGWLDRLANGSLKQNAIHQVLEKWFPLLESWKNTVVDEHEVHVLFDMRQMLKELIDLSNHHRA